MAKILHVWGDDDFGALAFTNNYDPIEVAKDMKIGEQKTLVTDLGLESEDKVYAKLLDFGDVDPKFIEFVRQYIQDYDDAKNQDFYLV